MDMKDDTKTRKATVRDSLAELASFIWAFSQPCMILYISCKIMPTWPTTICAFLAGVFYITSGWVTSFRIEEASSLRRIRKHSPRANFFRVFDADEEIQNLKRQAHCAENPQQFEEALAEICSRFYDEGYAVRDLA